MCYLMMTMLSFGGLVVTAQLNPMAVSYHVDKVIVVFGMSALVMAITVDRYLNGLTRPFWGWVSDHIGRENTMFIAFTLERFSVSTRLTPLYFVCYEPATTACGRVVLLCVVRNAVVWTIRLLIRALLAKGRSFAAAGNASVAPIASPLMRRSNTKA